jgi:ribonuclease HI
VIAREDGKTGRREDGQPRPLVAIYADESCLGNGRDGDNPGGAGVLLEFVTKRRELIRRDLWVSSPATTNNRMALASVIATFRALNTKPRRFRVAFCTDSRYIVDGMTNWVYGWARMGWTRKSGAIENLELWFEALRAASPHAVAWRWVRGHAGHAQNEYANFLAMRAAQRQDASEGFVESGFGAWSETHPAAAARLEAFPAERGFRASRALPATR